MPDCCYIAAVAFFKGFTFPNILSCGWGVLIAIVPLYLCVTRRCLKTAIPLLHGTMTKLRYTEQNLLFCLHYCIYRFDFWRWNWSETFLFFFSCWYAVLVSLKELCHAKWSHRGGCLLSSRWPTRIWSWHRCWTRLHGHRMKHCAMRLFCFPWSDPIPQLIGKE